MSSSGNREILCRRATRNESALAAPATQGENRNMQQHSFAMSLRSTRRWLGAALAGASLMLAATHAFAGGTEQLKAFVSQVRSAKGDFTQQIVKARRRARAPRRPRRSPPTIRAARSCLRAPASSSGRTRSRTSRCCRPTATSSVRPRPEPVTERKLNGALGASPAAILFGSNDLEKNYTLRDAGERAASSGSKCSRRRRTRSSSGSASASRTARRDGTARRVGNVTLLTFTIQTNPPLKGDTFVRRAEGR